jgi:hypothetical protein
MHRVLSHCPEWSIDSAECARIMVLPSMSILASTVYACHWAILFLCILHLTSNFLAFFFPRKDLSAGGHALLLCWVIRLASLHLVRHVGSPRCGIANEPLAEQHNQKFLLRLHVGRDNRHYNVGKPLSPALCALCFASKNGFPLLL